MILSFKPLGKSERQEMEARVQINYPFPTTILLHDGQLLDRSLWWQQECKVLQADKRERRSLMRMGLL